MLPRTFCVTSRFVAVDVILDSALEMFTAAKNVLRALHVRGDFVNARNICFRSRQLCSDRAAGNDGFPTGARHAGAL